MIRFVGEAGNHRGVWVPAWEGNGAGRALHTVQTVAEEPFPSALLTKLCKRMTQGCSNTVMLSSSLKPERQGGL